MISMLKTALLSVAVLSPAVGHADEKPELYEHGPDSVRHAGVPRGEVTKHEWRSKIYENTVRDYWVYVPAQYDGETPACLMVFQDGHLYVNRIEFGSGGHNGNHGGAIFPDSLRWLWRGVASLQHPSGKINRTTKTQPLNDMTE
jgi:hypothetical protein